MLLTRISSLELRPGPVCRVNLSRIFHEKSIPMTDLLNSTALYSKNVLNVLSSTISLIFLHMPCRINHFHHLITKSREISGLL